MNPLDDIPTEWLERCLAVMALDPETAGDHYNQPVGLVCGVAHPEYGIAMYDLACQICGATWVGVPGDPCWWCQHYLEVQLTHQADLLLTPPDVDPDDATYEKRMQGWSARMLVGVQAGLITAQQSTTAWHRALKRDGAA